MTEINLRNALSYDEAGDLLAALGAAGMTVEDVRRITDRKYTARAAVLAAKTAMLDAKDLEPVPYNAAQIRAILAAANVPEDKIDAYSDPEILAQLIYMRSARINDWGLEVLALLVGVSSQYKGRMTLQEIADNNGVTRERIRQAASRTSQALRNLAVNDRPSILAQVTEGPLSKETKELLGLLG